MEYDYVPLPARQPLTWPNGAREEIAEWYLQNHESYIPGPLA